MDTTLFDDVLEAAQQLGETAMQSGDVIAVLALLSTIVIFTIQSARAARIEKQQNYLSLELASNEVFRFEAENAAALAPFTQLKRPPDALRDRDAKTAECFSFMTLNLFEIAIRMRREGASSKDVFGSWVVWFYDTLCGWSFREDWPRMRENYTAELRAIFDKPVADFDPDADDEARKRQFFRHVATELRCPIIREWLPSGKPPREARGRAKPGPAHPPEARDIEIVRARDEALADAAAALFHAVIERDPDYISHSEYFYGRSHDGKTWRPDIAATLRDEFRSIAANRSEGADGAERRLLVARCGNGDVVGTAVCAFQTNGAEKYAVLEDLAVAEAERGAGIGGRLLDAFLKDAREWGAARVFLESGAGNTDAHAYFEARGFKPFSSVYSMPL